MFAKIMNSWVMRRLLIFLNLILFFAFPISWTLPIFEVGIFEEIRLNITIFDRKLPALFGYSEVTVLSTVGTVWSDDKFLAIIVAFFALVAPMLKVVGVLFVQLGVLTGNIKAVIEFFGRLAMADVFLIALGCVIVKGLELGDLKVLWGTYVLFCCVFTSILVSTLSSVYFKPESNERLILAGR